MNLNRNPVEKLVKVKILGKDYHIRSNDETSILRIAGYLNQQLEQTKAGSPVLNTIDLSVMTAFRIASDYLRIAEELDLLKKKIDEEAAALAARIDDNL